MGDVEDFHRDFLPRFIDAQRAFHDGDAGPNSTLWSTTDPVSLFAARGLSGIGTEDVMETFRFVASWFSDVRSYEWELLISDVSGDMAYTVAIERYTASREGQPPRRANLQILARLTIWAGVTEPLQQSLSSSAKISWLGFTYVPPATSSRFLASAFSAGLLGLEAALARAADASAYLSLGRCRLVTC